MKKNLKVKYIAILSTTTLTFIIGIIIGQLIAEYKMGEFSSFATKLRTSLLTINTQEKIASEYLCDVNIFKLTEEKSNLGRTLTYLEDKFGKDNERIIELKKEYSLISIRQFLLAKKYSERCKNLTIILFFYSNVNNKTESEMQGFILDSIYLKYPEKVVIYALDYDLDCKAIDTLENVYNITQVPSLVINDKTYLGFVPKNEIENIILQNV